MPIHEFECKKCGVSEVYLRTSEKAPRKCSCGAPLKKRLTSASIGLNRNGNSTVNQDTKSSLGGDFINDGTFSINRSR